MNQDAPCCAPRYFRYQSSCICPLICWYSSFTLTPTNLRRRCCSATSADCGDSEYSSGKSTPADVHLISFRYCHQMKQHLFSERKAHTSAHAANGITSVAFTQWPTLRSDITATSVTNRSAQTASTPMRRRSLVFRSHRHSVTTIFPTG